MDERLILRVGGLPDTATLLELGRQLDVQPELRDVELVRNDPADAWLGVTASSPEMLTKVMRRLTDSQFNQQAVPTGEAARA